MSLRYDSATGRDAKRSQPGTVALRKCCLAHFEGCEDAGIYNFRPVRGGKAPSVHGDGRAWDAHFDQPGPGLRNPKGDALANWCVANADAFSIQCVIWNRRIWSVTRPYWRTYGGTNPHLDHVHIEQNWDGANNPEAIEAACRAAFSASPEEELSMADVEKLVAEQERTNELLTAIREEQKINDAILDTLKAIEEAVKK